MQLRFPIVSEDEFARQGFTECEAFERLTAALPPYLVPIATASYHTGIRLGELKKVEWPQVDFTSKLIRLRRGRTKGGQPRTCPFIASMEKVLLAAKKERDEFWPDCQYVFARLGKPLKDIRGAWNSACDRAGVPALQFHDLRRSGVRNLTRAGVPEKISMEIIGHKTRSTFDRYNIVAEAGSCRRCGACGSIPRCQEGAGLRFESWQKPWQRRKRLRALERSRALNCFIIYGAERGT